MFTKCMCMKQTATCTKTILIVRKMKYLEEFRLLYGVWIVLDFSICCYTYDSTFLPDIEDQQFMQDCIKTHNYFRSRVNPSSSNMLHMVRQFLSLHKEKAWFCGPLKVSEASFYAVSFIRWKCWWLIYIFVIFVPLQIHWLHSKIGQSTSRQTVLDLKAALAPQNQKYHLCFGEVSGHLPWENLKMTQILVKLSNHQ